MIEIWKDIPGSNGNYQISNTGKVKSVGHIVVRSNGRTYTAKEKILKPGTDCSGYHRCAFPFNGKLTTFKVHRLVADVFCKGKTSKRNEVNHKDGNKINNNSDNLEWVTRSENCKHSFDIGLQKPKRGSLNGYSKLKELDIPVIMDMFNSGITSREIAYLYGMDKTIFLDIKNRKCWSHVRI